MQTIRDTLNAMGPAFDKAMDQPPGTQTKLYLVSSLAAGADQIIARAGLDAGYELQAILPTAERFFAADVEVNCGAGEASSADRISLGKKAAAELFDLVGRSSRVMELSAASSLGKVEYLRAAGSILANSDILLAAMSETATDSVSLTLVRNALDCGVPVVLLLTEGGSPKVLRRVGTREVCEDLAPDVIHEILTSLVLSGSGTRRSQGTFDRLRRYFEQRYFSTFNVHYNEKQWEESWPSPQQDLNGSKPLLRTRFIVESVFRPLAVWADYRSTGFSSLYRGAFWLNAGLGLLAVLAALTGGLVHEWSFLAKSAELIFLLFMSGAWLFAKHGSWRDQWLMYRALYQETHHAAWRFVFGIGIGIGGSRLDETSFRLLPPHAKLRLDSAIRAAGIPMRKEREEYLKAVVSLINRGLIERQIRYFESESQTHAALHHANEWRIRWLVRLAILMTALYLMTSSLSGSSGGHAVEVMGHIATFAGVMLPGLAGMLVALGGFEEYSQMASRYTQMSANLGYLKRRMEQLKPENSLPPYSSSRLTGLAIQSLLEATLKAASQELVHWYEIIGAKDLDTH